MGHLEPGGREEGDVGNAEQILNGEKGQDSEGEGAILRAQAASDQPDDEGAGEEADGGVEPANAEQPGTAGGEVLGDGGEEVVCGVERVAEGGEGAGDADDERGGEAGEGEAGRAQADGAAHGRTAAREEVRSERKCGKQEQRVGEVESEVVGPGGGSVVGGVAEQNEERAEQGFIEGEDENGNGEGAGEMTAGSRSEGPEEEGEDAEEIDAAGGAVGEFDEGGKAGVMLDDGAVTERPVVAAAGAGARGADG